MNKKYAGSFHLKPAFLFVKYCQETPLSNCRVCAYLLININEVGPLTGNMLVVFILNQPFYLTPSWSHIFLSLHVYKYFLHSMGYLGYQHEPYSSQFTGIQQMNATVL